MNPSDLARGTLVYFNALPDKQYGFIQPIGITERDKAVFCHRNYLREYYCDGGDEPAVGVCNYVPTVGEEVFYDWQMGPKGPRADVWIPVATLPTAQAAIESRPLYRLRYREGELPKSRLQERPKYQTLWEGVNLVVLRRLWPLKNWRLFEHNSMARWFEIKSGKEWLRCDDPR